MRLQKRLEETPQENNVQKPDERDPAPGHPWVLLHHQLQGPPSTRRPELWVSLTHRNRMLPLVLPNPWIPTHQTPPLVAGHGLDILPELGIASGQLKGNVGR